MVKSKLRKTYLTKQRTLSTTTRSSRSRRIAETFFEAVDLAGVRYLHCFVTIEKFNEVDTTPIFQRLWDEFPEIVTLVPRVNSETGEIENLRFTPDTELVQSVWGIPEPSHNEHIDSTNVDLVLVPLLCFDRKGSRVGYGKGFYDRFLAKCRTDCQKVGLSYFPPVAMIVDTAEHDVRLDKCIAPGKTYEFA